MFTRQRPDVRDVPADVRESLNDGDNEDDQECQVNEHGNQRPEHDEKSPNRGDATEDHRDNRGSNVEENPHAAKDDRLHGVEAHEIVSLFQNVKDDPANERYARDGRDEVRRQIH